jgi:hypothetical protein
MPPQPANPGEARGSLAADRQAPHISAFPISENFKNLLSTQENRYKVRKNLRKFLRVGNQIWNTFIIDTSSNSSHILKYLKDSKSKLI